MASSVDERRHFGQSGESTAELALRRRGFQVLERNARTRRGEIDLVCRDSVGYVFVEVKTRRENSFVPALEAASTRKVARLARLAEAWLARHGQAQAHWRLMLVAITVGAAGTKIELVDVD